jgi:hypothetical protein
MTAGPSKSVSREVVLTCLSSARLRGARRLKQRDRLSHLLARTRAPAGRVRPSRLVVHAGHCRSARTQCHCTRGVTLPGVIEKERWSIDVGTRTALSAGK